MIVNFLAQQQWEKCLNDSSFLAPMCANIVGETLKIMLIQIWNFYPMSIHNNEQNI